MTHSGWSTQRILTQWNPRFLGKWPDFWNWAIQKWTFIFIIGECLLLWTISQTTYWYKKQFMVSVKFGTFFTLCFKTLIMWRFDWLVFGIDDHHEQARWATLKSKLGTPRFFFKNLPSTRNNMLIKWALSKLPIWNIFQDFEKSQDLSYDSKSYATPSNRIASFEPLIMRYSNINSRGMVFEKAFQFR